MALSLEDQVLVWQKVKNRLSNESTNDGTSPATRGAFKALREYLATQAGGNQLQYIPFTEVQCDANGGTDLIGAASTLYAVYVKKENNATDNWFWLYDDANDTTDAKAMVCLPL